MYIVFIVLFLLVLPAGSVLADAFSAHAAAGLMLLVGKWFVFWAGGVRLFLAGLRQVFAPHFTAEGIFNAEGAPALAIVREVGFGNLSMGALGLASLARPGWLLPAATVAGLYYGLAGAGHLARRDRNFNSSVALISDLLAFIVLSAFVISRGF